MVQRDSAAINFHSAEIAFTLIRFLAESLINGGMKDVRVPGEILLWWTSENSSC